MGTVKVCSNCGGDRVYFDAFVSVNDSSDVLIFDSPICDDCGGETKLVDSISSVV